MGEVFLGEAGVGGLGGTAEVVALVEFTAVTGQELARDAACEVDVGAVSGDDGRVIGVTRCARCACRSRQGR